MFRLLQKHGVQSDCDLIAKEALTVAIKDGLESMVELLLQHGLQAQDDDIIYAIKEGNAVIVEIADPGGRYRDEQRIKKEEKREEE